MISGSLFQALGYYTTARNKKEGKQEGDAVIVPAERDKIKRIRRREDYRFSQFHFLIFPRFISFGSACTITPLLDIPPFLLIADCSTVGFIL